MLHILIIGPIVAQHIVTFFQENDKINSIEESQKIGINWSQQSNTIINKSLSNKIIVFLKKPLVVGEKVGSKLTKAQALGIKIINEADLINL